MVQAIQEYRKTKTRRTRGLEFINKEPNIYNRNDNPMKSINRLWDSSKEVNPNPIKTFFGFRNLISSEIEYVKCPYGNAGDILYVRETFYAKGYWQESGISKNGKQKWSFIDETHIDFRMPDCGYKYEDNQPSTILKGKSSKKGYYKRPSLFLPKKACRLFLQIKSITVERLNDISARVSKNSY